MKQIYGYTELHVLTLTLKLGSSDAFSGKAEGSWRVLEIKQCCSGFCIVNNRQCCNRFNVQ